MEYSTFEFKLSAIDEIILPPYKGSAFRGVFGHSLRRILCITKMRDCYACLLKENCGYYYLFETENQRGEKVSRPFVIEPPMTDERIFPPGNEIVLKIILFGNGLKYLPYIIYSFKEMGKMGLGSGRGKYRLLEVNTEDKKVYSYLEQKINMDFEVKEIKFRERENINHLRINFITPTALKEGNKVSNNFSFENIILSIKRRLKSLSYYHDEEISIPYFEKEEMEKIVNYKNELKRFDWMRYSGRQKKLMEFNGVIGNVEFKGNLTPFYSLLRIGEIIHIGRGTVFGMGKYVLEIL